MDKYSLGYFSYKIKPNTTINRFILQTHRMGRTSMRDAISADERLSIPMNYKLLKLIMPIFGLTLKRSCVQL